MTAHAFALRLPHFARDESGRLRAVSGGKPDAAQQPERPVAEVIAEAEERGRRLGAEEVRAGFEQRRAEDRAAFEAEMDGERRKWTEETAERLATDFAAGLDRLQSIVVDGAASAVAPFIRKLVVERSLDELAQIVSALLHDGRHVRVRVRGPDELLARLKTRLESYQPIIEYAPGDGPDVAVALDNTVVETRVAAWTELLGAVVSGKADD